MNIQPQKQFGVVPEYAETHRQVELDWMKRFATELLGAVTILFIVASLLETRYWWARFVGAAMVGALADWFAVTALFRHPLGLKIPHTAIIPSRKDSIGRGLGLFVQNNFLDEEIIASKVRSLNLTERVALWLRQPEQNIRIAALTMDGLMGIAKVVRDDDIQHLIEQWIMARIQATQVAPLMGKGLERVASSKIKQDLLIRLIQLIAQALKEKEAIIRAMISRKMPWITFGLFDNRVYHIFTDPIETTLENICSDPTHPFHEGFNARISQYAERLQHDPEEIARWENLKQDFLQQPIVHEFAIVIWMDIKAALLTPGTDSDGEARMAIQRAISGLSEALLRDVALRAKIDQWMEQAIRYLIKEYGHEVGQLIAQTVSRWDAEETGRKIELQVGKDLQYVRINGTIVGGLAGLVIYTISLML